MRTIIIEKRIVTEDRDSIETITSTSISQSHLIKAKFILWKGITSTPSACLFVRSDPVELTWPAGSDNIGLEDI